MAANNTLRNASACLKKLFLICGIKQNLICRMTAAEGRKMHVEGGSAYIMFSRIFRAY